MGYADFPSMGYGESRWNLVILGFGEDGHFIALLLTKKSQKEIAESHAMLLWIKWPFLGPEMPTMFEITPFRVYDNSINDIIFIVGAGQ